MNPDKHGGDNMTKIKFLTDTASDIPLSQAEAAGIEMLSFMLTVNGDSYQEQRDLSKEEFYELLEHANELPSTSQITAFTFEEIFRRYLDEGYTDVIYVSINASGSATYQNACNARETLYEDYPEAKEKMQIHILDSGNYTMTYGYPILQAKKMADEGKEVGEILAYLQNWLDNVGVYFLPMTLKYVKKSGRLTAAAAFAGELLGLRPIIRISHGEISVAEKVRGEKNIIPKITDKICSVIQPDSPYIVINGSSAEYADQVAAALTEKLGYPPAERGKIGSAVAINAGYDLVAVAMLEKQN